MILDERTEFADATALSTAGTGRVLVGDVINSEVARDLGAGKQLYLVISIDTALTSGGAAVVGFELVSDAQAALAVDGTASFHGSTPAVAYTELTAGKRMVIALPLEGTVRPYEKFIGLLQNVSGAALTAGKINAYLTFNPKAWKAYADGV